MEAKLFARLLVSVSVGALAGVLLAKVVGRRSLTTASRSSADEDRGSLPAVDLRLGEEVSDDGDRDPLIVSHDMELQQARSVTAPEPLDSVDEAFEGVILIPTGKHGAAREEHRVRRAPERRGGRPRGTTHPSLDKSHRIARPELVCLRRDRAWLVGLEMPPEMDATGLDPSQDGKSLEPDPGNNRLVRLRSLSSPVVCADSQYNIPLGSDCLLLFRLAGDLSVGRRVIRPSTGRVLAIVPDSWQRDINSSGSPPAAVEPVHVPGYTAHHFDLLRNGQIGFRRHSGPPVLLRVRELGLRLEGVRLDDAASEYGPLFGGEAPKIVGSQSAWSHIGCVVLGEEGSGSHRWRKRLQPDPDANELALSDDVPGTGWYFLRFYDAHSDLLDSWAFRFAKGLTNIRVDGDARAPGPTGYVPVVVTFSHHPDVTIMPQEQRAELVEQRPNETSFRIPPAPDLDITEWRVFDAGGNVVVRIGLDRLWWQFGREGIIPQAWTDQQVNTPLDWYQATSPQALWVRLPLATECRDVRVSLGDLPERRYQTSAGKRVVSAPLREMFDPTIIDGPMVKTLLVGLMEARRKCCVSVGVLSVVACCRRCDDFSADDENGFWQHVQECHVDELFRKLQEYDEVRKRIPSLPRTIYRCNHCDLYFAQDPLDSMTSRMTHHLQEKHQDKEESFRIVKDVDEIRSSVIQNFSRTVPLLYVCVLCGQSLENPKPIEFVAHLRHRHCRDLMELR